ncbi:MAG: hypothetical protein IT461_05025 [Planctomycetes bacterium]|nr:hypothetical protein [Planctomycetota bacterium]
MAKIEFSDMAREYAANLAVIQRVEKEFEESITAFWDSLYSELALGVKPLIFGHSKPTKQWTFWASNVKRPEKKSEYWPGALLWTEDAFDTRIVLSGELHLIAGVPSGEAEICKSVRALAGDPKFSAFCKPDTKAMWYLFRAQFKSPNGADMQTLVEPITGLLRAMHEATVAAQPK